MKLASFGLGLTFLSACLGTTPQATRPGPASPAPVVGVVDTSATSADPIYVVDGVEVPPSGLEAINPKDVASVTVLKGLDAIAAYGERGRSGAIEITLVPRDARAQPCRAPTPATAAVASILVADLVQTEPYAEQLRVDSHQSTRPMVRLFFKVLHGWKRNPFSAEVWHEGDTLIFNVTADRDPRLPAGVRVLVYLQPSFNGVTTQAGDTAITSVEDTGFLELFPCNSVRRVDEAESELQLLGQPDWRAP